MCGRWLSIRPVNLLARPVGPVGDQGQLNRPGQSLEMTVDNSLIAFFDLTLFEELTERALHYRATCKQQKP